MKYTPSLCLLTLFITYNVSSMQFYVAPYGSDSNDGSKENPVETIKKAQTLASAGDTVYIRGGDYKMREDQITEYYSIWAYVTKLDKDGITYLAYQDEKPVFDFGDIKPAGKRVIAFYLNGNNIHIKGIDITGVQVTITTHTQSECFEIHGSNNTLEEINMYDNMAIGVYILRGSNNLILNCDAYRNWDSVSQGGTGGNVDGFGVHAPNGHKNNVFRGCRAWFNSDDGFDLINSGEPVLLDNCWAFYNGYSSDFKSRGDGNGFKAGGYGRGGTPFYTILSKYYPIPQNTIQFCLAVGNKQSGFYSNHHIDGNFWYHNTAYRNKRNYNMLNVKELSSDGFDVNVPGWNHVLINNLGLGATFQELTDIDKSRCTLENNYFDLDVVVNADDFVSMDESELTAPRQEDGSLPDIDFLKLVPNSDLVDAGKILEFEFNGNAPDLGYSEYDAPLSTDRRSLYFRRVDTYPNPFSKEMQLVLYASQAGHVKVTMYNMLGMEVTAPLDKSVDVGKNSITISRKNLAAANYILVVEDTEGHTQSRIVTVQ